MEEDIKAIQEYIEYDKEHRIVTVFDKKPLFRDRLENLLKRYKELEEENKTLKGFVSDVFNSEEITIDSIPISVIQNKLIEAEHYINNVDVTEGQAMYKVLQELLQESEK